MRRTSPDDRLRTGVCYYPEHWPEARWASDAAHMRKLGLSLVRVGEFAWSRLEDPDGTLHLDWLARALDVLHAAGLEICLGTPTATPPAWLVERHPGMLAVDENGRVRGFGSRRHYCFSYAPYRDECARIVTALATRFGTHPGVVAWQTDNEYGCHDTILSYSDAAIEAFRAWCRDRYGDIDALNAAWGNVFWSMEYRRFDEIGPPVGAVTETNPAHRMAYWRCASEQVARFDAVQLEILRRLSPGTDVLHNYMGNFVEFDHRPVARRHDVATWDNYPLGFLTRDGTDDEERARYLRTGSPDGSAFHHDLYRGMTGNGRWWVMEQQPGPVNWAPYNPAPLDGMARLWGWEAFAHGAEVTSWFRWRQAPFGQEQTHTGLLLSNGDEDVAAAEVRRVNEEIAALAERGDVDLTTRPAPVAIVFDYPGVALQRMQQPGGRTFDPLGLAQDVYRACRRSGLDVDVVAPDADLSGHACVLVCTSTFDDAALVARLAATDALVVVFPRTGSRTSECAIPDALPPGAFRDLIDVQVVRTETLPPEARLEARVAPGTGMSADGATGLPLVLGRWRERVRSDIPPRALFEDGWGFHYAAGRVHYLNALPSQESLEHLLAGLFDEHDIPTRTLGQGLRVRGRGNLRFAFNFGPGEQSLEDIVSGPLLMGDAVLRPAGVAAWLESP